jgi:Taurine catabolism dioxygenase TauD, TfdA family
LSIGTCKPVAAGECTVAGEHGLRLLLARARDGVKVGVKHDHVSTSAIRLTGIGDAEGKAILPFLRSHVASPNYVVDFGWSPGDFVLWDNQATLHYAVNDYDGPRVYRKVIGG